MLSVKPGKQRRVQHFAKKYRNQNETKRHRLLMRSVREQQQQKGYQDGYDSIDPE
jgi:hypothetical protein